MLMNQGQQVIRLQKNCIWTIMPAIVCLMLWFPWDFSQSINTTGDYTTDDLPRGFDLVFLSAIIHSNPLEVNRQLIKKCYNSLNKNGKIVIQDWIMNNDRTLPVKGALFAINMLVGTEAGDCYTEEEVTEILNYAGFKNISRLEFETGLSQMTAQKVI
jgi:hypothetical protein